MMSGGYLENVEAKLRGAHTTHQRTGESQQDGSTKLVWITDGDNHLADTEKMHEVLRDTIEVRLDEIRDEWIKEYGEPEGEDCSEKISQ